MIHRPTIIIAGMIVLSAVAARPCLADVYYVTYTGTASGQDMYGLFGTAGAVLSNTAFTSTYTYDPSRFGSAHLSSGVSFTQVDGGTAYGVTDPILSATITINGHTYQQGSSYKGQALVESSPYLGESADSSASNYLTNYGYVIGSPTVSLTAVQSFAFSSGQGQGSFSYDNYVLNLSDTYVSVTDGPPTTVPEPASLALLGGAAAMFGLGVGVWRPEPITGMTKTL